MVFLDQSRFWVLGFDIWTGRSSIESALIGLWVDGVLKWNEKEGGGEEGDGIASIRYYLLTYLPTYLFTYHQV